MLSHLDYSSFKALNGDMEREEKGHIFLLAHFLIASPPKINHSMIPLASHLYLTSVLGSLQD